MVGMTTSKGMACVKERNKLLEDDFLKYGWYERKQMSDWNDDI